MALYEATYHHESDPILNAVVEGKAIIFEGEEAPKAEPTEDKPVEQNEQEANVQQTAETNEQQEPQDAQQQLASADQIAEQFKSSGALKECLQVVFNKVCKGNPKRPVHIRKITPFLQTELEKFVQDKKIPTNSSIMSQTIVKICEMIGHHGQDSNNMKVRGNRHTSPNQEHYVANAQKQQQQQS